MSDQRAGDVTTEYEGSGRVTVLERPQEMPVLSLWQPWAQLIVAGRKTIETRSWSTKHRGPLAIHAAKKKADFTDPIYGHCSTDGLLDADIKPLVFGAIVATCTLVDVVPMVDDPRGRNCLDIRVGYVAAGMAVRRDVPVLDQEGVPIPVRREHRPEEIRDVADQRPYGDFRPGRFAWLLADVVALDEPVPFKGGQGLTKKWAP